MAFKDYFDEILRNTNIKVIHLIRENTLEEFISLKKAEKSNQWTSEDSGSKTLTNRLKLDKDEFNVYLQESRRLYQKMIDKFQHHESLEISYEKFVNDQNSLLFTVQKFLNVTPRNLFSLLKKQSFQNNESITNYDTLKQAYKASQ